MPVPSWQTLRTDWDTYWETAKPGLRAARGGAWVGVRRSWPFFLIAIAALGGVLALGMNLSTAYPSEQRPFGWPGTATFPNGVAMVRKELVLAAALPALGLGLVALRRLDPRRQTLPFWGGLVGVNLAALALAVLVGGGLGAWVASKSTWPAFRMFLLAHVLLAWALYALTLFLVVTLRRPGQALAVGAGVFFLAAYDNILQWRVFREAGFHRLQAGDFPDWFLAAQAWSPVSAYRGILILGWPGFRDGLENAVLKDAVLPPWANAWLFAGALTAIWIVMPLGLAAAVWKARALWAGWPRLLARREPGVEAVREAS